MAERPQRPAAGGDEDPFLAALKAAEWDDETYTDEERAATAEGKADIRRGTFVTLDELRRILGDDANGDPDAMTVALLAAPFDDEPLAPDDAVAADLGWQEHLCGESDPIDVVRRRLLGDDQDPPSS